MLSKENIITVLIAAISAYYFGWLKGTNDTIKGVQPGQIVIDGQKYLIPVDVYNQIKGILTQ